MTLQVQDHPSVDTITLTRRRNQIRELLGGGLMAAELRDQLLEALADVEKKLKETQG